MPQPVSSKRFKKIKFDDTISARPKHAIAALQIVAEAAECELGVGKVLVSLSPENGRRLAEQYNSQENDAKKGATVEATAAVLLSETDQGLLRRALAKHRSLLKERTPFAHWIYAYTDEDEDILILVDPKQELLAEAEAMFIAHNWMGPNLEGKPQEEREAMVIRHEEAMFKAMAVAWCYDLKELERLATRLRAMRVCLMLFQRMVTWKGAQEARDAISQSLEECLRELDSSSLRVTRGAQTRER